MRGYVVVMLVTAVDVAVRMAARLILHAPRRLVVPGFVELAI